MAKRGKGQARKLFGPSFWIKFAVSLLFFYYLGKVVGEAMIDLGI